MYDNPLVITYDFGSSNFATPATATSFKGPPGKVGKIVDIGVRVTTLFTNVTTAGAMAVGTSADADAYALLQMGAAAATDFWNVQDDPDAIINDTLPANTQIEITFVAPTGGTPAGVGVPQITVAWY